MSKQDRQSVIAPAVIVATGLAAATAAIITSSFGVAGTLIGAVLTPVIITAGSAIYKAYIESASNKIRDIRAALEYLRVGEMMTASQKRRQNPHWDGPTLRTASWVGFGRL